MNPKAVQVHQPLGKALFDLGVERLGRVDQLRNQQGQDQHKHQQDAQQGKDKADDMEQFCARLLLESLGQTGQPLFNPIDRHMDENRQDGAHHNGADQEKDPV